MTFGIAALIGAGVVGGTVGGVVASSGPAPSPKVALVQRSGDTGTTGNTGAVTTTTQAAVTTTTIPIASSTTMTTLSPGLAASSANQSAAAASAASATNEAQSTATTTTATTASPTYCTGSLASDNAAPPFPAGDSETNGQPCTDSVGSFFESWVAPGGQTAGLAPPGWYRVS